MNSRLKTEDEPEFLALISEHYSPTLDKIIPLYLKLGGTKEAPISVFWDFFDLVQASWRERKSVDNILGWY